MPIESGPEHFAAEPAQHGQGVGLDLAGQCSVPLLQGTLSTFLVFHFGPLQPFAFFMLAAHIIFAGIFWHWSELIDSAGR